MLELKNITKKLQNEVVIDHLSLVIEGPGLYGISGPTGCGKTTLLNIIGGIDTHYQGQVLFHQKDIKGNLENYRLYHVGYAFQGSPTIAYLNGEDHLNLFTTLSSKISEIDHEIYQQDLALDFSLKVKTSKLSGGQRQRLSLLTCLYKQTEILLCDEPTSALDPKNADLVMALLKKEAKNKIIIIVSHDQDLLEKNCDCIYYYQDHTFIASNPFQSHQSIQTKNLKPKQNNGFMKMIFKALQEKKSRKLLTLLSVGFCSFCFLFTLLLSQSLKKEVFYSIRKLFPDACLSIKLDYPISLETAKSFLDSEDHFYGGYLNISQVELVGIKKVDDENLLFISDATQIAHDDHLAYGRNPSSNQEIVLSKNTYEKLFGQNLKEQKVQAVYRYQGEEKAILLDVVGVSQAYLSLDTIYEQNFAPTERIESLFNQKFEGDFLMAYYKGNLEEVLQYLNSKNIHYEYKEVGKSFVEKINNLLSKINQILYLVCSVVLLSIILFLVMVVYLNTIERTKQIGYLLLFGASKKQIYVMEWIHNEILGMMGVMSGVLFTKLIVDTVNQLFLGQLGLVLDLQLENKMIFSIAGLFFILIYLIEWIPRFLIDRIDLVDSLKQSTF
mgnify:CR=1 FL=1